MSNDTEFTPKSNLLEEGKYIARLENLEIVSALSFDTGQAYAKANGKYPTKEEQKDLPLSSFEDKWKFSFRIFTEEDNKLIGTKQLIFKDTSTTMTIFKGKSSTALILVSALKGVGESDMQNKKFKLSDVQGKFVEVQCKVTLTANGGQKNSFEGWFKYDPKKKVIVELPEATPAVGGEFDELFV